MTASEHLDSLASLLYETGTQMLTDVMKSEALPPQKKIFLGAWARRLQESSHFIFGQKEAGLLGEPDIAALVQLDIEVARAYRERREIVPA